MSRVLSVRVVDELAEWVDGYAKQRRLKRGQVVEMALTNLRGLAEGGVPDAPRPPIPPRVPEWSQKKEPGPVERAFAAMEAERSKR